MAARQGAPFGSAIGPGPCCLWSAGGPNDFGSADHLSSPARKDGSGEASACCHSLCLLDPTREPSRSRRTPMSRDAAADPGTRNFQGLPCRTHTVIQSEAALVGVNASGWHAHAINDQIVEQDVIARQELHGTAASQRTEGTDGQVALLPAGEMKLDFGQRAVVGVEKGTQRHGPRITPWTLRFLLHHSPRRRQGEPF